jgi:probable rRNA maturation factor
MVQESTTTLIQTTKGKLPSLPFVRLKEAVLGNAYELSIAIVGNARSQKLNKTYRGKNKPTNVLSFSLSKTNGEIVLAPKVIARDAKKFALSTTHMTAYLLIHGMLHLKGLEHGSTMERHERNILKRFKIPLPSNLKNGDD